VLRDYVCGGGWHSCRDCGSRGDLISLASKTLGLSVQDTLAFLAAKHFDVPMDSASVRAYVTEQQDYADRLTRLWNSARQDNMSKVALRVLMSKINVHFDHDHRSQDRFGPLVGITNVTAVEQAFSPASMAAALAQRHTTNTSGHRVFLGPHWSDVLALAYSDMPGRISGFLFVGRDAHPSLDFVYKRADRGFRGNRHVTPDAEAGLAFDERIFEHHARIDRTVVAVGDPVLMLQLQFRQLRLTIRPLNLVSWLDTDQWPKWKYDGRRTRTQDAWQMLFDTRIVFWSPTGLNIQVLRQAIATEGSISTVGPSPNAVLETLNRYLQRTPPKEILDVVIRNAAPWHIALSRQLEKCTDAEVQKWLVQIEHEQENLDYILSRLSGDARDRMNALRVASLAPRTIDLDGKEIREIHNCWYRLRRGRPMTLLLNAALRVDRILINSEDGTQQAIGRVLFDDRVVPFCEPLATLETNAVKFLSGLVLDSGAGILQCDTGFSRHLLRTAINFHEPERVDAVARVGWDPRSERYLFPGFQIAANGQVSPTTSPLLAADAPGRILAPPSADSVIPPQMLQLSEVNSEITEVFWAVLAAIITNIAAPKWELTSAGICLVGAGAQSVGLAVSRALGCAEFSVNHPCDVESALRSEAAHGMPLYCKFRTSLVRRAVQEFFEDTGVPRNCVVEMDWYSAQILSVGGGWHVIEANGAAVLPEAVARTAALVLPEFLREDSALRQSEDESCPPCPVAKTLWRLAEFVRRRGVNPDGVYTATNCLRAEGHATSKTAFVDLVGRLVAHRRISMGETEFKRKPRLIVVPERNQLVLPHTALVAATRKVPLPLPSPAQILARIEHQSVESQTADRYILSRSEAFERWRNDPSLTSLPPIVTTDTEDDGLPNSQRDPDMPCRVPDVQSASDSPRTQGYSDGSAFVAAHSKQ